MLFSATPVTVLSGFLGSGKTTLINRLLHENHGRRLAIIENEYGEVGVDAEFIERCDDEAVIQLDNGCVCCTVRGDLANALARLADDRQAGKIAFDHVVIETTGLADPGPITRTFMAETAILEHYFLDGVVTLVDALNSKAVLDTRQEARAQVAYADLLVITKCDLVDSLAVRSVTRHLGRMNPIAKLIRADEMHERKIFPDELLDIRGFQFDRSGDLDGANEADTEEAAEHGEACEHSHDNDHDHLSDVVSIHWENDRPIDSVRFDAAMDELSELYPLTLWRIKGVIHFAGVNQRVIAQGVNGLLQLNPTTYWRPFESRKSRLVLIGEKLNREGITSLLESCAQGGTSSPN